MKLKEILEATGGRSVTTNVTEFTGFSIDSRTIKEGELFIALKGDQFDGHDFVEKALRTGAGAIVKSGRSAAEGKTAIEVEDPLAALQQIAGYTRGKMGIPVVGVTGTNGKTTTKELLASILGQRRKVLKTRGNLNNHIGLPLSICNARGDEDIMVLEMGSNAEGDIKYLCDIAKPDYAVVTNVGPAHLEGFGSLETVRKTDLEIVQFVKTVSLNADDRFLMEGVNGFKGNIITYAAESDADVRAEGIKQSEKGSSFRITFKRGGQVDIKLRIAGMFNVTNAIAAASIASELGCGLEEIKNGLESFGGVPMRLEIFELCGALILSDVYNANPASMQGALKELSRLKKERAIAVLGDMLELGSFSESEHIGLVRLLSSSGVDLFIAVGSGMAAAAPEFHGICHKAQDAQEAGRILLELIREGDTVLIKGSRGMRMENVLAAERQRRECRRTNAL